ncbi:MAG TPA: terminase family protein [Verrucomicrobiae bacterium]|nr:terminase family protein [Verrucomicrobiae bacterium]
MPAILPSFPIDNDERLTDRFMRHQVNWILAEDHLHARNRAVFALAEKSVRIGWTHADAFKNFRKRLRFPNRDYLFATKDYPSAVEYVRLAYKLGEIYEFTRDIVSHGEDYLRVPRLDQNAHETALTDEIKIGYIKFVNGSRIIAFSSNPQAMSVYGGDVGLDEFAKHPNAKLLWETAQARVTWGYDIAVWSSHNGDDTAFYHFAQDARAGRDPWNLYYRVTIEDALDLGLLDVINKVRKSHFKRDQFLADCHARATTEEVYQQTYMCNPAPAADSIVDWNTIERCRADYSIERVHLEAHEITAAFGNLTPGGHTQRETQIHSFLRKSFANVLNSPAKHRLGFDVAASGHGNLSAIYIDEVRGNDLWLQALFTCRTEDWHFLETALFFFLRNLHSLQAAGDESGLGRQICWNAARHLPGRFTPVNFTARKSDMGIALMNQLSSAQKRLPRSEQDIAADFFALRKHHIGQRVIFKETRNLQNPASHCDIAWAGALASEAHNVRVATIGSRLG